MATMLVVEGNVALGQQCMQLFEDADVLLAHATSYQQTVAFLEKSMMPDLILLDMALQDGLALVHYIQTKLAVAPSQLIVVTDNENFYAFAEDLQIEHVFHKSTPFSTLARYINHLVVSRCNPS